jgi:hypothetical protein
MWGRVRSGAEDDDCAHGDGGDDGKVCTGGAGAG